ncbi:CPBP family intramembrane glutamic endopeptidase [Lysinibacillus parviboronicapiens]|uniref:CPBP family intramembrane glutamic endopeptidase n=1 Tax=Lysinibacillus parviboronicapiens TaxID=436516 RepID=UPI0006D198A9|nr:CPBP family intramembrane glutamic endopeptidase [Lysinibacillus parviboronicapiens]
MHPYESLTTTSKNRSNVVIDILFVLFLPLILVPLSGLVLYFSFPNADSIVWHISIVFLSMASGFCFLPYLYLRKMYGISIGDFGIKTLNLRMVMIGVVSLILVEGYLYVSGQTFSFLVVNSIQMAIVAFTEEFWARGALCFLLAKISTKPWFIILLSSLCFAFLTHINEPVMDNLLYRFPGALVMGMIYVRTGNLFYTIVFHFSYNMISI